MWRDGGADGGNSSFSQGFNLARLLEMCHVTAGAPPAGAASGVVHRTACERTHSAWCMTQQFLGPDGWQGAVFFSADAGPTFDLSTMRQSCSCQSLSSAFLLLLLALMYEFTIKYRGCWLQDDARMYVRSLESHHSFWGPTAGKMLFFPPGDTSSSADLVFGGVTVLAGVLGSLGGGLLLDRIGGSSDFIISPRSRCGRVVQLFHRTPSRECRNHYSSS